MATVSYTPDREQLLNRLHRIEGQVRGITRMVESDRYCVDVIQQIASMQAAADSVAMLLLEDHVRGCVAQNLRSGKTDRVEELVAVVRRYLKR